ICSSAPPLEEFTPGRLRACFPARRLDPRRLFSRREGVR
ncbi:hypothetical protein O5559_28065, partial [Escherichia coli]|nr:hypothetical protein [Escherichia coli]